MVSPRTTDESSSPSAHKRMGMLMLLAKGRAPSWRGTKNKKTKAGSEAPKKSKKVDTSVPRTKMVSFTVSRSIDDKPPLNLRVICLLWIICTCAKVLLIPSYFSSDLLVHRHWKAVTLQIENASEWYFDNKYAKTRHTLDYPPGFMLLEYGMARVAQFLVNDDRMCFGLRNDANSANLSMSCIRALRATVMMADMVYWIGAYCVAVTTAPNRAPQISTITSIVVFCWLIVHPALLWLDHVHFQYNGALMGVLLLSLACLLKANIVDSSAESSKPCSHHLLHVSAIALFSALVTMKHLYLTSLPWFVVYVGRRYCVSHRPLFLRCLLVILTLGAVAFAPCAVCIWPLFRKAKYEISDQFKESLVAWCQQLLSRLFPFDRGLLHSYWAGNTWAIFAATQKVATLIARHFNVDLTTELPWLTVDKITPSMSAVAMILAQMPGLRLACKAAKTRSNTGLLQSFCFVALSNFLFQFHAHEKAILTCAIPSLLLMGASWSTRETNVALMAWDITAVSLLGLFPLLYQPQELLFKATSFVAYLAALHYSMTGASDTTSASLSGTTQLSRMRRQIFLIAILTVTIVQLELVPLSFFGRYEFLPLATTSLVCASFYVLLYFKLLPVSFAF